jgi:pseudouridine kinase
VNPKPLVVVIGGMNIDIQARCYLPYIPGDSNPGAVSLSPGGVGRNIAENLARLGARVELITVLGDDTLTSRLEASCAEVGIGLEGALRLSGSAASQYICLLDSDGSLAGAVASMEAMERLTGEQLERAAPLLDSAALIVVDANLPEATIAWLAARYPRGRRRPLLGFDPVSVSKAGRGAAYLGAFDFAKPNRAEAAILAGMGTHAGSDPRALAAALRSRGLGEAFISLGNQGMLAAGAEIWSARPPSLLPHGLETINASGAGDAACAAIAWGLLEGADIGERCGIGERCALAVAAAMLAAASGSPVNPHMNAALLRETAKGIERERLS